MSKAEARRIAKMQDRLAAKGMVKVRRELRRAWSFAAGAYKATGRINMPDDFRRRMEAVLAEIHLAAVTEAAGRVRNIGKALSGFEAKFDWPELAKRFAMEYAANYMGQKIVSIEASLVARVVSITRAGLFEGLGQEDIAERIVDAIPQASLAQAATIARTEVHGANGYAAMKTAEVVADDAIIEREWVAVDDSRVRETHAIADGQRRAIGQPFEVGGELLMYPGDPSGSAENVINCRCVAVEVLKEAA